MSPSANGYWKFWQWDPRRIAGERPSREIPPVITAAAKCGFFYFRLHDQGWLFMILFIQWTVITTRCGFVTATRCGAVFSCIYIYIYTTLRSGRRALWKVWITLTPDDAWRSAYEVRNIRELFTLYFVRGCMYIYIHTHVWIYIFRI